MMFKESLKVVVIFVMIFLSHNNFAKEPHVEIKNGVNAMLFPIYGDATNYLKWGRKHAESIKKNGLLNTLQQVASPIRPWGIVLLFTTPFLFIEDPVLINYFLIFINLLFASISMLVLISWLEPASDCSVKKIFFIMWLSLCMVPFIPISMSDLISLCFFLLGINCIYRMDIPSFFKEGEMTKYAAFLLILGGLNFAIAGILKQNHLVHTWLYLFAVFFVYKEFFFNKMYIKKSAQFLMFFLIGFSFCLSQFFYILYHYGAFHVVSPRAINKFSPTNYQPIVELFPCTLPNIYAYFTRLDTPVNFITFYLIRLYVGITKLYLPIYHGMPPTPETIHVGIKYLIKVYGFFILFCFGTYIFYKRCQRPQKILLLSAFFITLFVAILAHTENRYYLYPRIIYGLLIINFLSHYAYAKSQQFLPQSKNG